MDNTEYTKLKSKHSANLNFTHHKGITDEWRCPEGYLCWSPSRQSNHLGEHFSCSPSAVSDTSDQLILARDARGFSDTAEILITCRCSSLRKPKRLNNSKKPKSAFPVRNSCSQLIISLPLKTVLDRSNQKFLRGSGLFNSTDLDSADNPITSALTTALAVGLKKMTVGEQIAVGTSKHISKQIAWKVDSCVIRRRTNDNSGAVVSSYADSNWNNVMSPNPFRSNIQYRINGRRALTSGAEATGSNNTGCIDLTDLSRVLDSTLNSNAVEESSNNGTDGAGQSCASSVPVVSEDLSIEDLSGYFEDFCHIPKKMSLMAELMYA